MDTEKIQDLLREHGDADLFTLAAAADQDGWGNIYEYLRAGFEAGLDHGGLWLCDHCGSPVEDPSHPDAEEGCHILDDGTGCGDTILCDECHCEAVAARAKIKIEKFEDVDTGDQITEEDDSALTDDEKVMAAYLDTHDAGTARHARSFISMYPRSERRDLHRYQDQIDAERSARGKQVG